MGKLWNIILVLLCGVTVWYLVDTNGDTPPPPLSFTALDCDGGLIFLEVTGTSDGTLWSSIATTDNGFAVEHNFKDVDGNGILDAGDRIIIRQASGDEIGHNVRISSQGSLLFQTSFYACS